MTRASRSGRTAWQFIQDLAGRLGEGDTSRATSAFADLLRPKFQS